MKAERWTGLAGLGFIVVIVPTIVAESLGPNIQMSPSEIAASFASARTDVLVGSILLIASQVALLAFAVGVATIARDQRLLSTLIVLSAAVGIAGLLAYATIYASVASSIHQLHSTDLVYGLFAVATSLDSLPGAFGGLMFVAAAQALQLSNLSGRWLTRLGVTAGALTTLSVLVIFDLQSFWLSLPGLAGTLLSLAWILITSIRLVRMDRSASA